MVMAHGNCPETLWFCEFRAECDLVASQPQILMPGDPRLALARDTWTVTNFSHIPPSLRSLKGTREMCGRGIKQN